VGGGAVDVTNITLSNSQVMFGQGRRSGSAYGAGISNTATLTVTSSTLSGNSNPDTFRGGVFNTGTLTVTSSNVSGNSTSAITNESGTLNVTSSTLSGNSWGGINNSGTLIVTSSTLSGNSRFGGIMNGSISGSKNSATVTSCIISDNSADVGVFGGGIANFEGTLTVTSSILSGNSAMVGGGIFNETLGTVTVSNSTFSGNSATQGGGIYNIAGTVTVSSSTLSGNSATQGGGIYNRGELNGRGTVSLTSSTLSANSAGDIGGGIWNDETTLAVMNARDTVLAGNIAPTSADVSGSLDSQGHNLVGNGTGGSGFADTDLVGTEASPIDPMLEPLGDYGGPTETMRPLPGSPVVNTGDNSAAPETDQRGFPRIVLGFIDIGAVELQPDEFGGPGGNTPRQGTLPATVIVAASTNDVTAMRVPGPETSAAHLGNDLIHTNSDLAGCDRAMVISSLFSEGQDQALINRLALFHLHQRPGKIVGQTLAYSSPLASLHSGVAEEVN
jgi:hypothetical protein